MGDSASLLKFTRLRKRSPPPGGFYPDLLKVVSETLTLDPYIMFQKTQKQKIQKSSKKKKISLSMYFQNTTYVFISFALYLVNIS